MAHSFPQKGERSHETHAAIEIDRTADNTYADSSAAQPWLGTILPGL
jgi:hypothetical protein